MGRSSGSHATDSRTLPVKNLDPLSMPCMCHAPLSHASTSTSALGGVYPALAPHGSRVSAVRLSLTSPMRGTPWAPKALFGSGRQAQSPKLPHQFQCSAARKNTELCGDDHAPVTRGVYASPVSVASWPINFIAPPDQFHWSPPINFIAPCRINFIAPPPPIDFIAPPYQLHIAPPPHSIS